MSQFSIKENYAVCIDLQKHANVLLTTSDYMDNYMQKKIISFFSLLSAVFFKFNFALN